MHTTYLPSYPLTYLLACLDAIKNTTGYAINALADFSPTDPIEILKRIMIGSEGTLGFVSQVTYQTVPDHPYKASAFLLFSDIEEACDATAALRKHTEVSARRRRTATRAGAWPLAVARARRAQAVAFHLHALAPLATSRSVYRGGWTW